jgi:hypothetical protein
VGDEEEADRKAPGKLEAAEEAVEVRTEKASPAHYEERLCGPVGRSSRRPKQGPDSTRAR